MSEFKRPRKFLGQNFLTDKNIQNKIVNAIKNIGEVDEIVEIGPGRGALTELLMALGPKVSIIEFDRDLAEYWRLKSLNNINLIESDFLELDLKKQFDSGRNRVFIGNIPYNITSQIIFKLIDHLDLVSQVVLMMQKEVADRLTGVVGTKNNGILSILCGHRFEIEKLFNVPRTVFNPMPKVESTVVRLIPKSADNKLINPLLFKEIVKRSFNQRRKMLRVSLKNYIDNYNGTIDLTRRPEQLTISEFIELSNSLTNKN